MKVYNEDNLERNIIMKNKFVALILLMLGSSPILAALTIGTPETFDTNLGDWNVTSGDVEWAETATGNGYARFGSFGTNDKNVLKNSFVATCTGEYSISFDYRFVGWDLLCNADDKVRVRLIMEGETDSLLNATSSVDLTTGEGWQTKVTPPPTIYLEEGDVVKLKFGLYEADNLCWLTEPLLITEFHLDNVLITATCDNCGKVPAPGAVLLAGFGTALVGSIRRRAL